MSSLGFGVRRRALAASMIGRLLVRYAQWMILGIPVLIFALLSGNRLLGLAEGAVALLLGIVVVRRLYPARIMRLEESVVLPWSAEVVWDLIKPAENSPLINPHIVRAYQVPGTPSGLGEQQAHERDDGSTVVIEVVEYRHSRRAVTRQVSPPGNEQNRSIETVEPRSDGCVYTTAVEIPLAAGLRVRRVSESAWRAGASQQTARIELILGEAARGTRTELGEASHQPTASTPPDQQSQDEEPA